MAVLSVLSVLRSSARLRIVVVAVFTLRISVLGSAESRLSLSLRQSVSVLSSVRIAVESFVVVFLGHSAVVGLAEYVLAEQCCGVFIVHGEHEERDEKHDCDEHYPKNSFEKSCYDTADCRSRRLGICGICGIV